MALFGVLSLLISILGLIMAIFYGVKKNPCWKKYFIGSIGSFILMIALLVADGPSKTTTNNITETQQIQTVTSVPIPPSTVEDQIEVIAKAATKDTFKKIEIIPVDGDKRIITLHVTGKDYLTANLTRKGNYMDGANIFENYILLASRLKKLKSLCICHLSISMAKQLMMLL